MTEQLSQQEIARQIRYHEREIAKLKMCRKTEFQLILEDCADSTGLKVSQLLGRSRVKRIAHARQDCWRMIRDRLEWSYPKIGGKFGRDHSTVIEGVRKAKKRAEA